MAITKLHSEVVRFRINDYFTGDVYECSTFDDVLEILSDFAHWHFILIKIRVVKDLWGRLTDYTVPLDWKDLQEMLALKR